MLDNGRISSVQLLFFFIVFEASTAILYTPARVAALAGPDSWLAVSLGDVWYGLLIVLVAVALGKRFPAQAFPEYLPEILGKVTGKLLAAAYALGFTYLASVILSEGSTFIHIALLNMTPPVVLDMVLAAVAAYGAYLGIEVIARENGMVLPAWALMVVLLLFLAAKDMNFGNLKPVLENGLLPVLRAGAFHSAWRGEVFLLVMFYPYLNQKHEALKTCLVYLGSVIILAGAVHAVIVGVFGDPVTAHMIFPFVELARYISLGRLSRTPGDSGDRLPGRRGDHQAGAPVSLRRYRRRQHPGPEELPDHPDSHRPDHDHPQPGAVWHLSEAVKFPVLYLADQYPDPESGHPCSRLADSRDQKKRR